MGQGAREDRWVCRVSHADQERKEGSRVYPVMGGVEQFPRASSRWIHVSAGGGGDDARAHGGVRACAHDPVPARDHARVSHLQSVRSCGGRGEYPGLACGCGLDHGVHGHGHDYGCVRENVHDHGLYHVPHREHAYPHAYDHVCGQLCDHGRV